VCNIKKKKSNLSIEEGWAVLAIPSYDSQYFGITKTSTKCIPYTYKFSRYIIFVVFVVDLLSAKFSSSKFIEGKWNDCFSQISELLHCPKHNYVVLLEGVQVVK